MLREPQLLGREDLVRDLRGAPRRCPLRSAKTLTRKRAAGVSWAKSVSLRACHSSRLFSARDGPEQLLQPLGAEGAVVGVRPHVAVHAEDGRALRREVQVGGAAREHRVEERLHGGRAASPPARTVGRTRRRGRPCRGGRGGRGRRGGRLQGRRGARRGRAPARAPGSGGLLEGGAGAGGPSPVRGTTTTLTAPSCTSSRTSTVAGRRQVREHGEARGRGNPVRWSAGTISATAPTTCWAVSGWRMSGTGPRAAASTAPTPLSRVSSHADSAKRLSMNGSSRGMVRSSRGRRGRRGAC